MKNKNIYILSTLCAVVIMVFSSFECVFAAIGTDLDGNSNLTENESEEMSFEEDDVDEFMLEKGMRITFKPQVNKHVYLRALKKELEDKYDADLVADAEREIRATYVSEPEYQEYIENFDETAVEIMIFTSVKNRLEAITKPLLRGSTSTYAWVVAPNVNQDLYYYCGPASALQAIAAWGGYVSGRTNRQKMDTLANAMGTDTSGTSYINLTATLNDYTSSKPYSSTPGNSMDVDEFLNTCYRSLASGYAPIIQCKTGKLDYYNGHDTGHFITVSGADLSTEKVRLVDPNYRQKYFGIRTLDAANVFSSINIRGRHLISTSIQ